MYDRAGYEPQGQEFMEEGIEHVAMEKRLAGEDPVPELRIDPLSGLRVIVAGERGERPGAWLAAADRPPIDPETDPFLEGHEDRTPPELYALRDGGGPPDSPGWRVRVVPNLYPALAPDGAGLRRSPTRWPPAAASRSCSPAGPPSGRTRWW